MWSYFSKDPFANFQYEFQDEINFSGKSLWSLHKGIHKTTKETVSIFSVELKNLSSYDKDDMKKCFKNFKILRHPNVLAYVDGIETEDKLCVVTEEVLPLIEFSKTHSLKEDEIFWGVHQISNSLHFLNSTCTFIHNNVSRYSIFVTIGGDWKLGGFEYLTKPNETCKQKLHDLQVYEPQIKNYQSKPIFTVDAWGLACVIWEIYNNSLFKHKDLQSTKNIPQIFLSMFRSLLSGRSSPWESISEIKSSSSILSRPFVKANLQLEEAQIMEPEQKRHLFIYMGENIENFPVHFCLYKLLPVVIDAFSNAKLGASALTPLLKIGKLIDVADDYERRIAPCVVKLFSSPDRATRMNLLKNVDCYVEYLKPSAVNSEVYPHVVHGFMDTNPLVREQTVKSMLMFAPKLSSRLLNDDLMKHLARMQSRDDQPGIRTNTTVCIGKLAGYIKPDIRQKALPSACAAAMRDPFPLARIAGINAMMANLKYFTIRDTGTKCLSYISMLTVDNEKSVRDEAFKAINGLLNRLQEASNNPSTIEELEKEVNKTIRSTSNRALLSTFTGWVMSSWVSKPAASEKKSETAVKVENEKPDSNTPSNENFSPPSKERKNSSSENTQAWEDFDEEPFNSIEKVGNSLDENNVETAWDDFDEESLKDIEEVRQSFTKNDEWGNLDAQSIDSSISTSSSTNFFKEFSMETSKKPAVTNKMILGEHKKSDFTMNDYIVKDSVFNESKTSFTDFTNNDKSNADSWGNWGDTSDQISAERLKQIRKEKRDKHNAELRQKRMNKAF